MVTKLARATGRRHAINFEALNGQIPRELEHGQQLQVQPA